MTPSTPLMPMKNQQGPHPSVGDECPPFLRAETSVSSSSSSSILGRLDTTTNPQDHRQSPNPPLSQGDNCTDSCACSSAASRGRSSYHNLRSSVVTIENKCNDNHGQDENIVTEEMMQAWLCRPISSNDDESEAGLPSASVSQQQPYSLHGSARKSYLSWDDYFMATACLSSLRSKEPPPTGQGPDMEDHVRGGCCIVHSETKRILAVGYTGFPRATSDEVLPWHDAAKPPVPSNEQEDANSNNNATPRRPWLWTREPYVVHAAVNAILNNHSKGHNSLAGARMYLTHFPCHECARVLIQAGIRHVIYQQRSISTNRPPSTRIGQQLLQVVTCSSGASGDEAAAQESIAASRIMLQLAGVRVQTFRPQKSTGTDIQISLQASVIPSPASKLESDSQRENASYSINNQTIHETNDLHLRHKFRDLVKKETRGYDPVVESSGRRPSHNAGVLLSWKDYFMALASLTAQRSKDPNTQVGACLVDSATNRIVGLGYNGFPTGCSDQVLPWGRGGSGSTLQSKYMYVCHAEVNAILNRIDDTATTHQQDTTLYVALFPCHACAKVIVQTGNIRRIVYQHDKYHDSDSCRASRILLTMANIELVPYRPDTSDTSITISLSPCAR